MPRCYQARDNIEALGIRADEPVLVFRFSIPVLFLHGLSNVTLVRLLDMCMKALVC